MRFHECDLTEIAIDAKTNDEAFRVLLIKLSPLLKSIVRRINHTKVYDTQDEFLQVMTIELWRATSAYDPSRETSFLYFAKDYLFKRSRSLIRTKFYTNHSSFNLNNIRVTDNEEDNVCLFSNNKENTLFKVRERYLRHLLSNKCMEFLTRLERQVLQLWYEGYSYKEIGNSLNITVKSVDNSMARVKKKFRSDNELLEYWIDIQR